MTVRRNVSTHDGFTISYLTAGEGPPLVLVPDIAMSAQCWVDAGHFDAFVDTNRVISIDPLGHGVSDAPLDSALYANELVVDDIVRVFEAEGLANACIWGYGEGAEIAALAARRRPDLISALVYGGSYLGDAVERQAALGVNHDHLIGQCAAALRRGDWTAYFDLAPFDYAPETQDMLAQRYDPQVIAALTEASLLRPREFLKPPVRTLAYWGRGEQFADDNHRLMDNLPIEWTTVEGRHDDGFFSPEVVPSVRTFVAAGVRA